MALAVDARLLRSLRFRAESSPMAPAIELVWEVPPAVILTEIAAELPVLVLRRERRFPGTSRRGGLASPATPADLSDGVVVLDSAGVAPDFLETREEVDGDSRVVTTRYFGYRGQLQDRSLLFLIRQVFAAGASTPSSTTVRVIDQGSPAAAAPAPGIIHYYTAFMGASRLFSRHTQSSALAIPPRPPALFDLLPRIHRQLDTTPAAPFTVARRDEGKGQLQRLIEVFEAHADLLRGQIDGLRDVHSVARADSRFLPALAHLVGWELKDFLDEEGARTEIGFAPEVYRSVGTAPNVAAIINRLTGWDARIKEFTRNVLRTWEASRVEGVDYLDAGPLPHPRRAPSGTVDTRDADAMYRLRNGTFDDATAYTYDAGRPDGRGGYLRDDTVRYDRGTIGVYVVPDDTEESFGVDEEWDRVKQVLADFLPIHVRVVFVLDPGLLEERYDTLADVGEAAASDVGLAVDAEAYGDGTDAAADRIPEWRFLITNRLTDRSVDVTAATVDTLVRTWHVGLNQ